MRVYIMSLLTLLFIVISVKAQKNGTIKFRLNDFNGNSIEVAHYNSSGKVTLDTILIQPKQQSVQYTISKGLLIRVSMIDKSIINSRYFMPTSPVTTIGYNKSKEAFELIGQTSLLPSNQVFDLLDSLSRNLESLFIPFSQAQKNKNQKQIDSISAIFVTAKKVRFEGIMDQVIKFPNTSVTAFLLYENFSLGISEDSLIHTYNKLGEIAKASYFGKKIKSFIQSYNRIKEGLIAPDFSLEDDNGKIFSLKSMRGKWVLIDFWASWCLPCRKKHPEMKETFQTFNGKLIEFIGVSLDEDQAAWIKAIKSDGLPWKQLIAPEGFNSSVAENYGVKAIPFSLLINPEGKIMKKNPSMTDIKLLLQ